MGFERFAAARSIAVVGASPRNLIARITLGNLARWGFTGTVRGVHPVERELEGVRVVATLADAVADMAVLAVGAARLPETIREAAAAGTSALVLPGAGANEGGREVEADLRAAIDETGVEAIGPNCMGFASLHEGVIPYVGTLDPDLRRGHVGLVSQSGSVCELFTALPWRVGFTHVISVGNELSIDLTDSLEYLVADDRTRAVGLFVEGVRRPHAFRAALRAAAERGTTVVALKVGRSEMSRAGTVAHTGALAGDDRVFSAVLRDAGAVEVHDLDEMMNALELLGKGISRPPGRVVFAGDSGGQANLFADLAANRGIDLPPVEPSAADELRERFPSIGDTTNPLDLWALGDPDEIYRDGVRVLVERQPHLVVLGLDKHLSRGEPERSFVRAGLDAVGQPGSVVLMAFAGGEEVDPAILPLAWERGIPVTRGADATLAALAGLGAAAEDGTAGETSPAGIGRAALELLDAGEEWTEHRAKRLLAAAGVEVTREAEVGSEIEAIRAAEEIGYPVVLKTSSPSLQHKTEAGAVRLHLSDASAVEHAASELLRLAPRLLVAEQVHTELELVVSGFVDEQFGPCALVGVGGIWTEAFADAVVVAGPGSRATFDRALRVRPWGRLVLDGARGHRFPAEAVWRTCARLLALLDAAGERVRTIEVNPLIVTGDRVVAVDALVVASSAV